MKTKQTTKCFASATLLWALVLPLQAQSALIDDGDFAAWTFFTSVIDNPLVDGPPPNASSGSAARITTGGNPDAFLQTTHTVTSGDTILTGGIKTDYSYNPAIDGSIAAISVSLDAKTFGDSASALEIVVEQGGIRYFSPPFLIQFGTGASANWEKLTIPNLTAANFDTNPWGGFGGVIPPDDNRPDFSASAAPLRFGVMVGSIVLPDGGGTATASHGIDNFSVNICGHGRYCDPAVAAQLPKLLDPPQPFTPPDPPPPLPDTRKRHVAVLVHGWNSEPAAWADETADRMERLLAARGTLCSANPTANPCWELYLLDWSELAGFLLSPLPQVAYVHGYEVGAFLAYFLEAHYGTQLGHVHLVGHSAGAHVIHRAARTLERIKRDTGKGPTSLHMTFLDAFTPLPTDPFTFGRIDNSLIPNFVESYATDFPPSQTTVDALLAGTVLGSNLKLASLYVWTQTSVPFFYAYNRSISLLDPDRNEFDPGSWALQDHAWPYQFYQCSIDSANNTFTGSDGQVDHPCPTEHSLYDFGFPIALEDDSLNTVQFLRSTWQPGGYCLASSTTVCTNPITLAKQAVENAVNASIDAAKTAVSATGKVLIKAGAKTYDLTNDLFDFANDHGVNVPLAIPGIGFLDLITGSPAWVKFRVDVPDGANTLRFNYRFPDNAEGYLRVFIHDRQIWSGNQRFNGTNQTAQAEIALDELVPGKYEIAFRLDTLDGRQARVLMTDFEMLKISAEAVPNLSPVANAGTSRSVRLNSVVTLDGSASADTDNAPSPLTYTWVQTAGPGVALNPVNAVNPAFTPPNQGLYRFSLTVNDGADSSTPDEVTITVPRLGDTDMDGDVDSNDLSLVTAARNKPASSANDLRDLDGNLLIDALDARKLTTLCTRPRCATR